MKAEEIFNFENIKKSLKEFGAGSPFPYAVVDGFFKENIAKSLELEFPDFKSELWHRYHNEIEVKKTCNDWNRFPPLTYSVFSFLNSNSFMSEIFTNPELKNLKSDMGLNGGGWHIHTNGGKLNPHLDYSIHPKLGLQRKLNIIIYLTSNWEEKWGGALGLWSHDAKNHQPYKLMKEITCKFNRAVIFDTTKDSWHGLSKVISCPENVSRKSIATYYLQAPEKTASKREKALFAPTNDQKGIKEIEELIERRSNSKSSESVYVKK